MKLLPIAAIAMAALAAAPDDFAPARYRAGAVPAVQVSAVGGGEVFMDVSVDSTGAVTGVSVLRSTPPFTGPAVDAVRGWQFAPAEDDRDDRSGDVVIADRRRPVDSDVFVGVVFRAPAVNGPTLGEVPRDASTPGDGVAFPLASILPAYPPNALFDGVVLTEAQVGADGQTGGVRIVRSRPPFDDAAVQAVRGWVFRPARVRGRLVPTLAYVAFAFRQPVTPN